jgi:hypothetical protein
MWSNFLIYVKCLNLEKINAKNARAVSSRVNKIRNDEFILVSTVDELTITRHMCRGQLTDEHSHSSKLRFTPRDKEFHQATKLTL